MYTLLQVVSIMTAALYTDTGLRRNCDVFEFHRLHFDGLEQNCGISSALALGDTAVLFWAIDFIILTGP